MLNTPRIDDREQQCRAVLPHKRDEDDGDDVCVTEATNKVLGDLLCLTGAVLYGVSNVFQEYLVCRFGSLQYLAAIGLLGSIVSGIQL